LYHTDAGSDPVLVWQRCKLTEVHNKLSLTQSSHSNDAENESFTGTSASLLSHLTFSYRGSLPLFEHTGNSWGNHRI